MHETLTEARYHSQAGAAVAWDFVEAMSQMCEFFVWDETVLKKLSRHYQTGQPLPVALIRKIRASKRHMLAYDTMRQAVQALYDIMIHTGNGSKTLNGYFRKLMEAHLNIRIPETSLFPAGFGHLAGGYDAGYYGYMWAKVYAVDMFTRFETAGLLDPSVGGAYRREILSVGSSRDEMDSVRAFLGREPSDKAFMKEIGIGNGRGVDEAPVS